MKAHSFIIEHFQIVIKLSVTLLKVTAKQKEEKKSLKKNKEQSKFLARRYIKTSLSRDVAEIQALKLLRAERTNH